MITKERAVMGSSARNAVDLGLRARCLWALGALTLTVPLVPTAIVQAASSENPIDGPCGEPNAIVGTSGHDVLVGTLGADVICALDGNDWIFGLNGDDTIFGGPGNDVVFAGRGGDTVDGGAGGDIIVGSSGVDSLNGGPGRDVISGGRGADVLHGGADDDWMYGGRGDDVVVGDAGADRLFGERGSDDLDGGDGTDRGFGGPGEDRCANIEIGVSCEITPVATVPTLSILTPTAGEVIDPGVGGTGTGHFEVTGTAVDPDGIAAVDVTWGGDVYAAQLATTTTGADFSIDVEALDAGAGVVSVTVVDQVGDSSTATVDVVIEAVSETELLVDPDFTPLDDAIDSGDYSYLAADSTLTSSHPDVVALAAGNVINLPPDADLPLGGFFRVVDVVPTVDGGVTATLVEVPIWEAFVQLRLVAETAPEPGVEPPGAGGSGLRAAQLGGLIDGLCDEDIGDDTKRCYWPFDFDHTFVDERLPIEIGGTEYGYVSASGTAAIGFSFEVWIKNGELELLRTTARASGQLVTEQSISRSVEFSETIQLPEVNLPGGMGINFKIPVLGWRVRAGLLPVISPEVNVVATAEGSITMTETATVSASAFAEWWRPAGANAGATGTIDTTFEIDAFAKATLDAALLLNARLELTGLGQDLAYAEVGVGPAAIIEAEARFNNGSGSLDISRQFCLRIEGEVGLDIPGFESQTYPKNLDLFCRDLGAEPDPELDVEVFTNGADADDAPGLPLLVGDPIAWRVQVDNPGNLAVRDVDVFLQNDVGANITIDCGFGSTSYPLIEPGQRGECTATSVAMNGTNVVEGRATGTAIDGGGQDVEEVSDSDPSAYTGSLPYTDLRSKCVHLVDEAFATANAEVAAQRAASVQEVLGFSSPTAPNGAHLCDVVPIYAPGDDGTNDDMGAAGRLRNHAVNTYAPWIVQARVARRDNRDFLDSAWGAGPQVRVYPDGNPRTIHPHEADSPLASDVFLVGSRPALFSDGCLSEVANFPTNRRTPCDEFPNASMIQGGNPFQYNQYGNAPEPAQARITMIENSTLEGNVLKNAFYGGCTIPSQPIDASLQQISDGDLFFVIPVADLGLRTTTRCGDDSVEWDDAVDLELTSFTATPTTLSPGGTTTFDVEATNVGINDAAEVIVQFGPFPSGMTGLATPTPGCIIEDRSDELNTSFYLACNDLDLAESETFAATATGTLPADSTLQTATVTATVRTISNAQADIQRSNDSVVLELNRPMADLDTNVSVSPTSPEPGDDVTITIDVTNKGPQDAPNVVVTVTLPSSLGNRTIPAGCTVGASPNELTCSVGDIPADQTASLEVTGTLAADADPRNERIEVDAVSDLPDPSGAMTSVPLAPTFPSGTSGDNGGSGPSTCAACVPAATPGADPGVGGTFSHPNLVTYDGRRYIFHGAGDYVLAESTVDDFRLHVRFSRMNSRTVSFNQAVAATVGDSVLSFGDDDRSPAWSDTTVRLDDEEIVPTSVPIDLPGGATIAVVNGMFEVVWPDASKLRVGLRIADPWTFYAGPDRWGTLVGLLGNADGDRGNDLRARDGAPFDYSSMELYDIFGASWLLDSDTTLFTSALAPIDRLPIIPSAVITLADLPPADVASADALCRAAGIIEGEGLAECVFDVALTGDPRWITGINIVDDLVAASISVLAEEGLLEDDTTVAVPGPFGGSLDRVGAVDLFRMDLAAGASVVVTSAMECTSAGTFEFALEAPGGYFVGRSTGLGCGRIGLFDLPETGEYVLRVYDTGGYTGSYALDVALPPSTIEQYTLDTVVSSSIVAGGEASYLIDVPAEGVRAFVDMQQCHGSIYPRWQLIDPSGTVVENTFCSSDRLVDLTEGTWTLRIYSNNNVAGNYRFRVWAVADTVFSSFVIDDVVDGSLSTPGAQVRYTFDVPAGGLSAFLDWQSCHASIRPRWQLVAPDGTAMPSRFCSQDEALTLSEGTWTLIAFSTGDTFGGYRFRLWTVAATVTTPIVLEEVVTGSLTTPGSQHRYTFDVPAGGVSAFVDWQACHGSVFPRWQLIAPDGSAMPSRFCSQDEAVTLSEGTWTLVAFSNDDRYGDYRFRIWVVADPLELPYVLGDVASGTLTTPVANHRYTFEVPAGGVSAFVNWQLCYLSTEPRWQLIGPDGSVSQRRFCSQDATVALSEGTWTLRVYSENDRFGSYRFRIL